MITNLKQGAHMAEIELELKTFGSKEAGTLFEQLPAAFQKRVLNTAARGGAAVVRKAAKANLESNGSIRTGLLHRSIAIRVKKYASGIVWAGVGADVGVTGRTANGKNVVPANYIHLVEFGTINQRAEPFLRPAVDANKTAIQAAVVKAAEKGLNRELKKLDKKTR